MKIVELICFSSSVNIENCEVTLSNSAICDAQVDYPQGNCSSKDNFVVKLLYITDSRGEGNIKNF